MPQSKNNNLALSDLYVGRRITEIISVSSEMILSYAALTGDYSAIHVSREAAIAAGFNEIVAHGALIVGFFSRLVGVELPGDSALVLESRNKFHSPVFAGDTLNIAGVISRLHLSTGTVEIQFRAVKQGEILTTSGKWLVMVRK